MLAWKVAPALAAGNTVVLKPAELTPLTALAFAELCQQIGLPPGVVNIVTGDGVTGAALAAHPGIDKVAFTGSTSVGQAIRSATAPSHKKLSLELGGKSPFIVFEDADLDSAVEGLVDGIFLNQGQVCCAGSRLLLQESIAEPFLAKLRRRMSTLRVGSPLDKSTDVGAIVSGEQLERIESLVSQGVAEGATLWQPECALPADGLYFRPTLLTNVQTTATVARTEIFGPVLVVMTFRTPAEAVEIANNTIYGLAASVWSENVNVALQTAAQVKAGVIWVNSTNVFDAACGFGGYRESGYGREGGREGMREYLEPAWFQDLPDLGVGPPPWTPAPLEAPAIDRTVKLYIGGKQARPDSGYSLTVNGSSGEFLGEVPHGNRKDIRNAVEAAAAASGWAKSTAHHRAQILYYIAENLSQRATEIAARLATLVGTRVARDEVELSIARAFSYAAWADKFDGAVHAPPMRNVAIAMNEPLGVVGVIAPTNEPLLGLLSQVLPLIAMGNTTVVVPSAVYPLIIGDLTQVLETSDLQAGVVNFVTGRPLELAKVLAEHAAVDAIWAHGGRALCELVKSASVGNLKQVFTNEGRRIDFFNPQQGEGRYYLEHATQVKNVWVPYGE